jgi:hypothetical protein
MTGESARAGENRFEERRDQLASGSYLEAAERQRTAAAKQERYRRRGGSGEHLDESLKQREEPFRFAGDQAVALREKDLEEEGEERASAALKSSRMSKQLESTFRFDIIAESCESSSAMTVLE